MRLKKIWIIASFEFLSAVKRKSYLIATFGMPVFILLYAGIISGIQMLISGGETKPVVYGIVDPAGILNLSGERQAAAGDIPESIQSILEAAGQQGELAGFSLVGSTVFQPFLDMSRAHEALVAGRIDGYFVLGEDYLSSGNLREYTSESLKLGGSDPTGALRSLLQESILKGLVSEEFAKRIRQPINQVQTWTVTRQGLIQRRTQGTLVARLIIPIGFTFLLFSALMMSAGYLVQGTAVEKENKVIEVLLSSAKPEEVLAGKLIGLGTAGLLQVLVWFGMVIFAGMAFAATLALYGVNVPWLAMGCGLFFFVCGYLFLGSLMLGAGSLGNSQRESQQLGAIWSLLAVVPMMFLGILMQDPHGLTARIMTWIPFTAPVTMIFRLTFDVDGVTWGEVFGSLLMLLLSTWFALKIGARLFRVGLVLTGSRPKWREILRQARLAR